MKPFRLAGVALAVVAMLTPVPLRGDDDALAKYRKPVDEAVDKALAYLAKTQHAEGYWPSAYAKGNTAPTGLAVMAFLAKGYTPGCGPYGETINKGIDFVLASRQPNGALSPDGLMYAHAISTLMLSEASGMVDAERQKRIDAALSSAVKWILTAQQVKKAPINQGGWRYAFTSPDSDLSCSGWALLSLRSARNNGAQVPKEAIDQAVKFVLNCRQAVPAGTNPGPAGVGFGYTPPGNGTYAMTGVGVLSLELCGKHHAPESLAGGDFLLANPVTTFGGGNFYYGLYYVSQAMWQLGGKYWEGYAPRMYEMMLQHQAANGSWPAGIAGEGTAGPAFSTAMGVLAVSVSYCQLPIYQR